MVTLAPAGRSPDGAHRTAPSAPAAARSSSVLRMGLGGRLAMAGGAIALLWSAIALGLS